MSLSADEKAARKAERLAATKARHDQLREAALRVANKVLTEYQQWGSNKTRAWALVSARLRGLAQRKECRGAEVRRAMREVQLVDSLTVEQCVALINRLDVETEDEAAEIEA